jgi:hypothetical protein
MNGSRTVRLAGVIVVALVVATILAAPMAAAVPGGGNQSCPEGYVMLKVDRPPVEGEVISDGVLSVTITEVKTKLDGSGEVYGFDIESNIPVWGVIVKGGPRSFLFHRMTDLDTFLGPSGSHYGVSWFAFCYTPPTLPA